MEDVFGTIQTTEMFLLGGGVLLLFWWVATSDAAKPIRDALSAAVPVPASVINQPPGTTQTFMNGQQYGNTTNGNAWSATSAGGVPGAGSITVATGGTPDTYGPSATVPGTGQTVTELRNIGYSNADIADIVATYDANPSAYSDTSGTVGAGTVDPLTGAGGGW